jgi:hypothetical protein
MTVSKTWVDILLLIFTLTSANDYHVIILIAKAKVSFVLTDFYDNM